MSTRRHIGYGSGNPNGIPDYRPINPWGRPVPKSNRRDREKLYQVIVEFADRKQMPMGPKWGKDAAEQLLISINAAIARGTLPTWKKAFVVPAHAELVLAS